MHPRATYVFELARKTGRMQRRLQLLPITDLQKELGLQGLRHVASKPQTTQMTSRGQSTYHLHSTPRTLPPSHPSEGADRGEMTEEGNSPCSSLGLRHNLQLLHQEDKKKEYITEETSKKKKKKSHFSTWEQIASQVNCTLTPQSSLVTATCSTSYFIRFANGIDLSTRLFINSHPTTRTEIATANRFSEDK